MDFLARLQGADARRLLIKSPTHSFRVRVIERLLPSARFLLVRRNPSDLWRSNLKMWLAMNSLYGLAPLTTEALQRFLRRALSTYHDEVQWMRTHLAATRYQEICYEALATDPVATLEMANAQLRAFDVGLSSGAIQAAAARLRRESRDKPKPGALGIPEVEKLAQLFGYEA